MSPSEVVAVGDIQVGDVVETPGLTGPVLAAGPLHEAYADFPSRVGVIWHLSIKGDNWTRSIVRFPAETIVRIVPPEIVNARAQGRTEVARALRPLVSDWQANGNSRSLGDATAETWQKCAQQLLAVIDAAEG